MMVAKECNMPAYGKRVRGAAAHVSEVVWKPPVESARSTS
jgi:hypothetical protein